MEKFKIICCKKNIATTWRDFGNITTIVYGGQAQLNINPGEVYDAKHTGVRCYIIYSNNKVIGIVDSCFFMTIAEYRDEQINEILNGD